MSVTLVDSLRLMLVIAPVIIWVKRISSTLWFENSILVNIFHLKYFKTFYTYSRGCWFTCLVNGIGWLPLTCSLSTSRPLYLKKGFFLLLISYAFSGSLMKFRPWSTLTSLQEGRRYFGCKGSIYLFVLNSLALGRAPSISSILSGLDVLFKCL